MSQPRLHHNVSVRTERRASAGGTRKCSPRLRTNVRREPRFWERSHIVRYARVLPASATMRRALLRAAHARVCLLCATMCGELGALQRAAHACYRPVSTIMCRERCKRLLAAHAAVTRICPPCLRHHVRRARRASAGGSVPPAHACVRPISAPRPPSAKSALPAHASDCGDEVDSYVCRLQMRAALRVAGGTRKFPPRLRHHVPLICGERGALLRAASASVSLVSATMCGERCAPGALLPRSSACGTRTSPPRLRTHVRGARRASAVGKRKCPPLLRDHVRRARRAFAVRVGTRKCLPRLRHHMRRARRALAGGTRKCPPRLRHHVRRARRASVGGTRMSPPHLRHYERRRTARYAGGSRTCPPRQLFTRA